MTEQELLLDGLRRLNRRSISYMLSGSMASKAWGIPRTTHGLDFVIQLPPSHIRDFIEAFRSEDYFVDEGMIRSAYPPPNQFNAIHLPSALKVDFWILKTTDAFEREMFRRRLKDSWLGETVWIATAEDVVLHKLYWNKLTPSDRQLGDVAGVVAIQKEKLDESYLHRWASELSVTTELEKALSGELRPKQT